MYDNQNLQIDRLYCYFYLIIRSIMYIILKIALDFIVHINKLDFYNKQSPFSKYNNLITISLRAYILNIRKLLISMNF